MSSADGSGPESEPIDVTPSALPEGRTDTLLVETLIHVLIEKGLLTKNDALSVVQTVAQVQQGRMQERGAATETDVEMLRRMFESFAILAERGGAPKAEGDNIYALRPPVHGDRVQFPDDD